MKEKEKRTHTLQVTVSKRQKTLVELTAKKKNLTVSNYILELLELDTYGVNILVVDITGYLLRHMPKEATRNGATLKLSSTGTIDFDMTIENGKLKAVNISSDNLIIQECGIKYDTASIEAKVKKLYYD